MENSETHCVKWKYKILYCAWFSHVFRKCVAPTYPSNDFRKVEASFNENKNRIIKTHGKMSWKKKNSFKHWSEREFVFVVVVVCQTESNRNIGYLNFELLSMHFFLLFSFRLGTSCYFSHINFDRNSISEVNWGISHICDWILQSYIPSVRSI